MTYFSENYTKTVVGPVAKYDCLVWRLVEQDMSTVNRKQFSGNQLEQKTLDHD